MKCCPCIFVILMVINIASAKKASCTAKKMCKDRFGDLCLPFVSCSTPTSDVYECKDGKKHNCYLTGGDYSKGAGICCHTHDCNPCFKICESDKDCCPVDKRRGRDESKCIEGFCSYCAKPRSSCRNYACCDQRNENSSITCAVNNAGGSFCADPCDSYVSYNFKEFVNEDNVVSNYNYQCIDKTKSKSCDRKTNKIVTCALEGSKCSKPDLPCCTGLRPDKKGSCINGKCEYDCVRQVNACMDNVLMLLSSKFITHLTKFRTIMERQKRITVAMYTKVKENAYKVIK